MLYQGAKGHLSYKFKYLTSQIISSILSKLAKAMMIFGGEFHQVYDSKKFTFMYIGHQT